MTATPIAETVSTKLQRIAELAREDKQRAFMSLAHHIDVAWLHEAFRRTRKDGATGVDGQTAAAYEQDLEANLQSLLNRFWCAGGRQRLSPGHRHAARPQYKT